MDRVWLVPRTHDDNWDLASSVGATATMVAAGRAMATKDPRGLINDPFAEPLVRAVGVDFFIKMMDGELDLDVIENATPSRMQAMIDGMAVRTKYFDDYFVDATGAGVRQAVILASGLDSRAYRLPWPAGTVVYEIDQPQVIEFKTTHAGRHRRRTHRDPAHHRDRSARGLAGGADARRAGHDGADGVVGRRPADLSAAGSPGPVVRQHHRAERARQHDRHRIRARHHRFRRRPGAGDVEPFRDHGVDIDMASLVYTGERNHVVDYLQTKGWDVEGVTRTELFRRNGLDVPDPDTRRPARRDHLHQRQALTG